ncbi:hypothetical protein COCC4DRAFT_60002 [Bipolaris maydis ATCC 48331]|uniref:Extracellular membrane protein CFEM domain-containing protein n=3 Tax=Cochliobolus heterostrophus TaxID=5016 RepID=M2UTI4_COCH5|nr:uncharacterized protein COCC4DRAFT_60002 [Bipolaris maydis ATCC 48331]EMD91183.1 hypothetical protein COCHEDRAFT_1102994 [Bipolaris maydis C5]ENI05736.1 hypothetical protein COCC4DRAFT_60002 [Bipolaris maydis ATCC 48331]KAH7560274.1 hypothetical protein BM1_03908 [Bipolaris maydis]KAJ6205039.1 hypothetical protein PSV09DRAFT_1102994 [Bipolaris maydis]
MHLTNILQSIPLFFLIGSATALPTDMSSTTQSASIANNRLALEARDGACSPKCKREFDSLQSCRWISYCMLSNQYNIKVRLYDNCCKLVHPPNAVDEKTREILEKSKAQAGFKPKTKTGGEYGTAQYTML